MNIFLVSYQNGHIYFIVLVVYGYVFWLISIFTMLYKEKPHFLCADCLRLRYFCNK